MPKKLLFVCNYGQNRSRTGADLYAELGYDTDYAGVVSATRPVTAELLEWADIVIVFEQSQADEIRAMASGLSKPIVNLGLPNCYCRGDPRLEALIRKGLSGRLG